MMGGLIMAHSDDHGLVLPPALAPIHLVVVPIFKTLEELNEIKAKLQPQLDQLSNIVIHSETLGDYLIPVKVKIDEDMQKSAGRKFNERELKGVPVRIAVGKRDLEQGQVEIFRRDTLEKSFVQIDQLAQTVQELFLDIQQNIYKKHEKFTLDHTSTANTYQELKEKVES